MANNVKFTTGLESNLPSTKEAGKVYFAVNDNNEGSIYFDKDSNTRVKMTTAARSLTINGVEKGTASLDNSSNPTITLKSNTFVIGTGATAGTWTGSLDGTGISALYDGLIIDYWTNIAGKSSSPYTTLNLALTNGQETGAKNVYYGGTTRLGTHYAVGNILRMVYRSGVSINGTTYEGWWVTAQYDSNTYDRLRYSQAIKASTAITGKNIIVGKDGGYFHLNSGNDFDITYPIMYAISNISASSTGTDNYLTIPFTITTTQSITLTAYQPVYIKGTLNGTTFTPISTTPLVQTVGDDGYYILLGVAYSTTGVYLLPENPVYANANGVIGQVANLARTAQYAQYASGDTTPIREKYISELSLSGQTLTVIKGDNNKSTLTTQDQNVTQTATSTNANYEVLFSNTADNTTRTEGARKNSNLTFNPSTGKLTATTFAGVLSGNASTASAWATSSLFYIQDDDGHQGSGVGVNGSASEVILKLPSTIKATLEGNADSATKLATPITIQTDLSSTSAASFDGSVSITPGITGTLAVGHGGTGATTFTLGYALIGNGTSAIATRAITNNASISAVTANTNLITANTLAYWNGAYSGTSSNLAYLGIVKGGTWNATTIGTAYGGTGLTSFTANRIYYPSSTSALSASSHYINSSKIAINSTSEPSYNFYVNGSSYLGGNITTSGININYAGSQKTWSMIRFIDNTSNVYGNGISIGGGGVVLVGAGESASNMESLVSPYAETLYLLSDAAINLEANANSTANRIGAQITTSGNIVPIKAEETNANAQSLGVSGNGWSKLYVGSDDSYGDSTIPIYWNNGVPTACTYSLNSKVNSSGTSNTLAYYSGTNEISSYTSPKGSGIKLWYLNAGVPTESSSTVGSSTDPVYLNSGTITKCLYSLGANVKSGTANRATYFNESNTVSAAGSIYMTSSQIGINTTSLSSPYLITTSSNTQTTVTPSLQVNGYSYYTNTAIYAADMRAIEFRPSGSIYNSYIYFGTAGNEALNFVNNQSLTSFIFWTGNRVEGSSQWFLDSDGNGRSDNPALQIKKNCVYINKLLSDGVTPGYNLYVNGTSFFNGQITSAGNIDPLTDSLSLGSSDYKWSKLYVGTADSYGSSTKPIYWNAGVPAACTYSLNAAVFSGTEYGVAYYSTAVSLTSTSAGTSGYLLQGNGSAAPSWIQATNSNTASTVVKRDSSGNFSAGTITASLLGDATTSSYPLGFDSRESSWTWGTLTTDNDYTQITNWKTSNGSSIAFAEKNKALYLQIDGFIYQNEGKYLVLDNNNYTNYTVTQTGSGASGTWGISISGTAAKATQLATARRLWGNSFNGTADISGNITVSVDGEANLTLTRTDTNTSGGMYVQGYEDGSLGFRTRVGSDSWDYLLYLRSDYGVILTTKNRGTSLPSSGVNGQIFFKY